MPQGRGKLQHVNWKDLTVKVFWRWTPNTAYSSMFFSHIKGKVFYFAKPQKKSELANLQCIDLFFKKQTSWNHYEITKWDLETNERGLVLGIIPQIEKGKVFSFNRDLLMARRVNPIIGGTP